MKHILEEIKKTVVFLGSVDDKGQIQANATAFLINVNNFIHLVTAKHVVVDPENYLTLSLDIDYAGDSTIRVATNHS